MVSHSWRIVLCFLLCMSTGLPVGLDICTGASGDLKSSSCSDTDAASSFIQVRSTKRSQRSWEDAMLSHGSRGEGETTGRTDDLSVDKSSFGVSRKLGVTAVKPFDCNTYGKALSMVKKSNGFGVCQIEPESGNCTEFINLSSESLPQLTDVSACGINPMDQIMYCVVFAWNGFIAKLGMQELEVEAGIYNSLSNGPNVGQPYSKSPDAAFTACNYNPVGNAAFCSLFDWKSYIIRIDSSKVEYVARLPPVKFVAGTFSPIKGIYFIATNDAKFATINALHLVKGYSDADAKDLLDLSGQTLFKPKPFRSTTDIVALLGDFDRNGNLEQYVVTMKGKSVYIAQYEDSKGNFTNSWVLRVKGNKWTSYNQAWSFQGKVFFSAADKSGIWEVPFEQVNLTDDKAKLKKTALPLRYIGPENVAGDGDGVNCLNSPDPWLSNITRFDCKAYPGPIQFAKKPDLNAYEVSSVDLETGKLKTIYTVPYSRTNPPFFTLNAVGISPIDSMAYGCIQLFALPANFYLVRFDSKRVEFVALLKGPSPPIAGTFDVLGNFYYMANPVLKRIQTPHLLKGFEAPYDAGLADLTNNAESVSMGGAGYFADIVAIIGDLAKAGSDAIYVLALNSERQLGVVEFRNDTQRKWLLPTADVLGKTKDNFGAAWNYADRVFWSANNGAGIFEVNLSSVDLVKSHMVNITYAGPQAAIEDNDGANCLIGAPYTVATRYLPTEVAAFQDTDKAQAATYMAQMGHWGRKLAKAAKTTRQDFARAAQATQQDFARAAQATKEDIFGTLKQGMDAVKSQLQAHAA